MEIPRICPSDYWLSQKTAKQSCVKTRTYLQTWGNRNRLQFFE